MWEEKRRGCWFPWLHQRYMQWASKSCPGISEDPALGMHLWRRTASQSCWDSISADELQCMLISMQNQEYLQHSSAMKTHERMWPHWENRCRGCELWIGRTEQDRGWFHYLSADWSEILQKRLMKICYTPWPEGHCPALSVRRLSDLMLLKCTPSSLFFRTSD